MLKCIRMYKELKNETAVASNKDKQFETRLRHELLDVLDKTLSDNDSVTVEVNKAVEVEFQDILNFTLVRYRYRQVSRGVYEFKNKEVTL